MEHKLVSRFHPRWGFYMLMFLLNLQFNAKLPFFPRRLVYWKWFSNIMPTKAFVLTFCSKNTLKGLMETISLMNHYFFLCCLIACFGLSHKYLVIECHGGLTALWGHLWRVLDTSGSLMTRCSPGQWTGPATQLVWAQEARGELWTRTPASVLFPSLLWI